MPKTKPCRWNGIDFASVKAMYEFYNFNKDQATRYLKAGYRGHGDLANYQKWYTIPDDKRVYGSYEAIATAYGFSRQYVGQLAKEGKVSLYVDCFRAPTKADYAMLNEWLESGDKALENKAQCVLLRDDGLSLWDIAAKLDIDEITVYEYLKRWNDGNE